MVRADKVPQRSFQSRRGKCGTAHLGGAAACHERRHDLLHQMVFDQPLTFIPLCMERVWGGHRITAELNRGPTGAALPNPERIGESWELVDRADAQSVVARGAHAGRTLHELWTDHRAEIFGAGAPHAPRFPLLLKILDARETLSVQVHPPQAVAVQLAGEPKTEMWYLLDATSDAVVYAGFRHGIGRAEFEQALAAKSVEAVLHKIPVRQGDAIFIPSGRCHAIGAGCLIVEIQQNSDTTYRVFDWNRTGLDAMPRPLHVKESLASIDFDDHEPQLLEEDADGLIVDCAEFRVTEWVVGAPRREPSDEGAIFAVLNGCLKVGEFHFKRGDFFVLPPGASKHTFVPSGSEVRLLRTTFGRR